MRNGKKTLLGLLLIGLALGIPGLGLSSTRGDEPGPIGRFGRLFRLGGNNSSTPPPPTPAQPATPFSGSGPPSLIAPPSSPALPAEASPRIVPQPRVTQAATDADPLITRIAIGRSDNGSHFGMFMQVYADGTVLDSEGVHHVGREAIKPLAEAVRSSDAFRLRGHCGGPPTDFIEQVHIVVYDRALGRLRANAFSFSGNPQGCDHAVRHLTAALDAIQQKLSGAPPVSAPASPAPAAGPLAPPASPQPTGGRTIPLTPLN
jgi:hypothetical protein